MIKSKEDLKEYLEADCKSLNRVGQRKPKYHDLIWRFERVLRYCEYYTNCKRGLVGKACLMFWNWRKYALSTKCNFTIPVNVFGKGLSIAHVGTIVINGNVRIGENCRIHTCVNIGTAAGSVSLTPIIGNNVYIGPGAKLFGSIKIADGVAIGANAVVNKDCLEENVTLVGAPARISSHKGSKGLLITGEDLI